MLTGALRWYAATAVVLAATVVPLSATTATAAAADPDCSAQQANLTQAIADRNAAAAELVEFTADVHDRARADLAAGAAAKAGAKVAKADASAALAQARDAYQSAPTPANRQLRDDARAAYAAAGVALDQAQQDYGTYRNVADLVAARDAARAGVATARQALANCFDPVPVTGTATNVVRHGDAFQAADLAFTPLFPYGTSGPTYRVVPVTICGALGNPACSLGSAKAGPDGVLRFHGADFAFCTTASETFEIRNADTNVLVASVPVTWTAAC